jgi:hypothetical protein
MGVAPEYKNDVEPHRVVLTVRSSGLHGCCTMPKTGSQVSSSHALVPLKEEGMPGSQTPKAQESPVVHALCALHAVPSGASGLEQAPVVGLQSPTA